MFTIPVNDVKRDLLIYIVVVILGIVIGYLLYPVFHKVESTAVVIPPDSTSMVSVPDTVWRDSVVLVARPTVVYRDTGKTKLKIIYDQSNVPSQTNELWSFKRFIHSKYVQSDVYALAPDTVSLFKNNVVVDWNKYYDDNILPDLNVKFSQEKQSALLKGIIAGGVMIAGITSKNPYIAGGGLLLAGGIVIFL